MERCKVLQGECHDANCYNDTPHMCHDILCATKQLKSERADLQRALDVEREKVTQLEQQLESANALIYKKNCALGRAEMCINDLQAQLAGLKRNAGLDCGDQSCLYAVEHTGMRTNGGCRCDPKRMKDDLVRSRKACDALQAQLRQVEGAYQKLLNVIDDSHDEDLPIEIIEARDEAYKFLAAQDEKPRKCPTCDSPSPHLHPAVQHEGEVQVCSNRWHKAAQDAGKEDVSHE